MASEETYEVLYSDDHFEFPEEFVEQVFKLYPPESEVGMKLWKTETHKRPFIWSKEESIDPSLKQYYKVEDEEPFAHGYNRLIGLDIFIGTYTSRIPCNEYLTKDRKAYYYLSCHESHWRDVPEIIALAKSADIINKENGLKIATVPAGYSYRIEEYDGMESVIVQFPYRQVIRELIQALKENSQDGFGPITKKLVDGSMKIDYI